MGGTTSQRGTASQGGTSEAGRGGWREAWQCLGLVGGGEDGEGAGARERAGGVASDNGGDERREIGNRLRELNTVLGGRGGA